MTCYRGVENSYLMSMRLSKNWDIKIPLFLCHLCVFISTVSMDQICGICTTRLQINFMHNGMLWSEKLSNFHLLHIYILYELSNKPHIRISLLKRFVKFYDKLKCCKKFEVRHLFNCQKADPRSVFGRNCFNLCREFKVCSVEEINIDCLNMPLGTSENDAWRVPFLKELLSIPDKFLDADLSPNEIAEIMSYVCCT